MLLVPLGLGPTSRASDSLAFGLFLNRSNPLLIRNCFQWWWQYMCGGRRCEKHVLFRSDNKAVVQMLNSRTSKIPFLMQLLGNLLLSAARSNPNTGSSPASIGIDQFFSRTAVSRLPYAWPNPIHSQEVCNRSKEVLQLFLKLSQLYLSGSPCPTDEWTLCLFATFLARFLHHSTIKVYLSGVRALNVEQGLQDPPQNCPRL
ncbi:unnamed protein product [Pocillopora meandrina]|uniref:Uncharacterized protein n=1 Tax=Pocillopora meandrina TaxID=46732 RepID=A0AAU9X778_9CNID|nr:unnamed protein product [Pocillopora meandrina]